VPERMTVSGLRNVMDFAVEGARPRGRPKRIQKEAVEENMKV